MNCANCGRPAGEHPPQWGHDPLVPLGVSTPGCLFIGPGDPDPEAEREFERLSLHFAASPSLVMRAVEHSQDWEFVHYRLRAACRPWVEAGIIYLVSGHRTWDAQNYLYQGWLARRPGFNPANPPGLSNHEAEPGQDAASVPWAALAVDVGGQKERFANEAGHLVHRPASGEDWHFQLHANSSPRFNGWGDAGHPWDEQPPGPPPPPPPPPPSPDPFELKGRTQMLIASSVQAYLLQNRHTGQVVDVSGGQIGDGAETIMYPPHGRANQRLYLDWYDLSTGVCRLIFQHSGRVLDLTKNEAGSGCRQWPYHGGPNQLWKLEKVDHDDNDGSDYFKISTLCEGHWVLDAHPDASTHRFFLWKPHGGLNQQWRFQV